ncbi:GNAT family N-acetyltransferase [Breoghania sp. L-A4]|uniref:GNAT family N-acetyltransferase n=1 Tax=Breoghania sp. L-A4 TaxID=2304600 RepID=UPI000E3606B0|nr:GNAT family N-acetyltransferase [Breoghania sp. L-A4]AXS40287.1 N-acetyltransferase [Breoghania sp. L-A4]
MSVSIALETPLQDEVRAMVEALNATMRPLSPPEFQFQMTAEQMAGLDTVVFVARGDDGKAVGMGALKLHDTGFGEVKRMYTDPAIRGSGVGGAILAAIEREAVMRGVPVLRLETGSTPGFEAAWAVYERAGFVRGEAFADYPDSEFNVFYEKKLTA